MTSRDCTDWMVDRLRSMSPTERAEAGRRLVEAGRRLHQEDLRKAAPKARRPRRRTASGEGARAIGDADAALQHAEMRREQHRERFLSETELRALFLALDEEPNQVAAGVLALLAATGARKGEALAARWEDIDLDRRLWTVPLSKSGRRRHIPLSDLALRILNRQKRLPGCPWVFPGKDPEKHIESVRKPWEKAKMQAGLPPDLRIHDLRHTFASRVLAGGASIHQIGQILGHRQIQMTMRYAHLERNQLVEVANLIQHAG